MSVRGLAAALAVAMITAGATRATDARTGPAGLRPEPGVSLLVPMDPSQQDHLKAYGLTYWVLQQGHTAEWLLNYEDGAFLLPDLPAVRRQAALMGVSVTPVDAGQVAEIRTVIQASNMDEVVLDKAPRVAVYTPPDALPWDDAVTMALDYAQIPYVKIWDDEVLDGDLKQYEWIHLHHEDFTGQYSKFYLTYAGAPWLEKEVARDQALARAHGFPNVPAEKKAVARALREYVEQGGFLFAMCSATETLDLALASAHVDIASTYVDGTPADPDASTKMDWSQAMAFTGAQVQTNPSVDAFSDIDTHQVNTPWRKNLSTFTLFDFSAKFDPVPAMLTQDHQAVIPDFYGLTTAFRLDRIKPGVIILAREADGAKYIHGDLGKGTFTFLGGHDPEDPEHQIGDAPTDLSLHPNSPGYRLILNNVLFPAAQKKKLKTQ
jgi:hypothetical protein